MHRVIVLLMLIAVTSGCSSTLDPADSACPRGTSRLAYTTPARELRQSDVAVLDDGEVVRVTHDQLSQDPSFSPDGHRMVFSSGRGGDVDVEYGDGYERLALFTATWDGQDVQRLTNGPRDMEPDWSPDGSTVVFARGDAPGQHAGGEALWTVDVETGDEQLVYRAPPRDGEPYRLYSPVWSPDGARIAFSRAGGKRHDLWLIDRDGSNLRRIVTDIGLSYFDTPALSWSPRGDALAFNGLTGRQYGLHVMDLDDRRPRMFDSFGEWPAWSPDGASIAYVFYVSDARWRLVVKDASGGARETVEGTPTLGYVYGRLDWARCTS